MQVTYQVHGRVYPVVVFPPLLLPPTFALVSRHRQRRALSLNKSGGKKLLLNGSVYGHRGSYSLLPVYRFSGEFPPPPALFPFAVHVYRNVSAGLMTIWVCSHAELA